MTTDERKAAMDLIRAACGARNELEVIASHTSGLTEGRISEEDLTFAMTRAMIVADALASALARCREANREAHRLIRTPRKLHNAELGIAPFDVDEQVSQSIKDAEAGKPCECDNEECTSCNPKPPQGVCDRCGNVLHGKRGRCARCIAALMR